MVAHKRTSARRGLVTLGAASLHDMGAALRVMRPPNRHTKSRPAISVSSLQSLGVLARTVPGRPARLTRRAAALLASAAAPGADGGAVAGMRPALLTGGAVRAAAAAVAAGRSRLSTHIDARDSPSPGVQKQPRGKRWLRRLASRHLPQPDRVSVSAAPAPPSLSPQAPGLTVAAAAAAGSAESWVCRCQGCCCCCCC
eukprot:TRINITY_DN9858_c0_g1_i1.p2 TRINITY_DN9858_c0_g1~~TRINITY_DN9858_c0_g1_i1.p2  ORF type:complete len:198 (+),score=2.59 TRINITY_DN9858_c0_g1_i1:104-697(+)